MPNWSFNSLSINGNNKDIVRFYKENSNITDEKKNRHLDFYKSVPIPKEKEKDWYDWNCKNLGTKWNIYESSFFKKTDVFNGKLSILRKILIKNSNNDIECFMNFMKEIHTVDTYIYNFDTAWSPPYQWLFTVSQKYPKIIFKIEFDIEGYDESGILVVQNGDVIHNESFSTSERLFKDNKKVITNLLIDFMKKNDNQEKDSDEKKSDEENDKLIINFSEKLRCHYFCCFDEDLIKNLINEVLNKN